jgi:ornithine cyclodeaminase
MIDAATCRQTLDWEICIAAMSKAMQTISSGDANMPLRTFFSIDDENGEMGLMPAAAPELGICGAKLITILPANPHSNRPAIQGLIALFSTETGELEAIIDGTSITEIRTAAASALATSILARLDAKTHGVLGTGVQAITHARAIAHVRPLITHTIIWGRDPLKARVTAKTLRDKFGLSASAGGLREAAQCDVVSTVTGATEPMIQRDNLSEGAHLNLVGSHKESKREVSTDIIASARLFVDIRSAALNEAGDILIPISEGAISENHICAELGEVLSGRAMGRQSPVQITVYKSLGNAIQDIYAATALLKALRKIGNKILK